MHNSLLSMEGQACVVPQDRPSVMGRYAPCPLCPGQNSRMESHPSERAPTFDLIVQTGEGKRPDHSWGSWYNREIVLTLGHLPVVLKEEPRLPGRGEGLSWERGSPRAQLTRPLERVFPLTLMCSQFLQKDSGPGLGIISSKPVFLRHFHQKCHPLGGTQCGSPQAWDFGQHVYAFCLFLRFLSFIWKRYKVCILYSCLISNNALNYHQVKKYRIVLFSNQIIE